MNEDESEALLDELLATETTSGIESEIAEIIRTANTQESAATGRNGWKRQYETQQQ
jgi:hypothetical protein